MMQSVCVACRHHITHNIRTQPHTTPQQFAHIPSIYYKQRYNNLRMFACLSVCSLEGATCLTRKWSTYRPTSMMQSVCVACLPHITYNIATQAHITPHQVAHIPSIYYKDRCGDRRLFGCLFVFFARGATCPTRKWST